MADNLPALLTKFNALCSPLIQGVKDQDVLANISNHGELRTSLRESQVAMEANMAEGLELFARTGLSPEDLQEALRSYFDVKNLHASVSQLIGLIQGNPGQGNPGSPSTPPPLP